VVRPGSESAATTTARHPLEPLSADEVAAVRDVIVAAGLLGEGVAVNAVALSEPPKAAVVVGEEPARCAEVVLIDRARDRASVATVDVVGRSVREVLDITGHQPAIALDDQVIAMMATAADPRWQEAVRRRGIDDIDKVQIDPWPTGDFVPPELRGRRLVRCISFLRPEPADNGYARPITGLVTLVDVNRGEVVLVEDHGVVPMPEHDGNYDAPPGGAPFRADLKPLSITQPDGPSFQVDGHHVRWQNWDFRLSLHPVEGLTLHQVGYRDAGALRSILYRASLAEMVVPYGDSEPTFSWRNAFDAGEVGLGASVNALELGCDCVGEIHYFDAVGSDAQGNPAVLRNAICMHEEDYGILWKHTDVHTFTTQTRRSRRLVVSSIYTLGNYEYGAFWYFYLDGTIQLEMKLTGIVATRAIAPGEAAGHAVEVSPGLVAPHHQHLFCFRLDFDIDGVDNTVYEVDVVARDADDDANRHGNLFDVVRTAVRNERDGGRLADPARARTWHIVNEARRNALGQPVGYRLEPQASALLLAQAGSSVGQRARFASKHLWVTRHDETQRRPAGRFPNQSSGLAGGIAEWAEADRPLTSTDTVVWHTFGPTHVSRPEDWPVMPVEYAGFTLRPVGFFDRNPSLDVPPAHADHCSSDAGH
jgi:primary-amine oxidase